MKGKTMAKGINVNDRIAFILSAEKESATPTVWNFGPLLNSQKMSLLDVEAKTNTENLNKTFNILATAIKSIKNLDGVDYEEGKVTKEIFDAIADEKIIQELMEEFNRVNFPTAQEIKN